VGQDPVLLGFGAAGYGLKTLLGLDMLSSFYNMVTLLQASVSLR